MEVGYMMINYKSQIKLNLLIVWRLWQLRFYNAGKHNIIIETHIQRILLLLVCCLYERLCKFHNNCPSHIHFPVKPQIK